MAPDSASPPPPEVSGADALLGAVTLGAALAAGTGRRVGLVVVRGTGRVLGPGVRLALDPPLLPGRFHPRRGWESLAQLGHDRRASARESLDQLLRSVATLVVDRALQLVPLTTLIREHVDLDALVAALDLDAVVRRVDVDAVIDRVDLVALAREVIVAIDLPEIIRESSGSLVNESVRGVRMQSIDADRVVEHLVERLLRRHGVEQAQSSEESSGDAP